MQTWGRQTYLRYLLTLLRPAKPYMDDGSSSLDHIAYCDYSLTRFLAQDIKYFPAEGYTSSENAV